MMVNNCKISQLRLKVDFQLLFKVQIWFLVNAVFSRNSKKSTFFLLKLGSPIGAIDMTKH